MYKSLYIKVLAVALFGMYLQTSPAQEVRPSAVEAGFCVGPTISWATPHTDSYESTGVKLGGCYGLMADINLVRTKTFAYFNTGIVFRHVRFGLTHTDHYTLTKKNEKIDSARITSAYNTVFLSIPTAIKLKTESFGKFAIFGIAGLEHGFRISAKSNDEVTRLDGTSEKATVNRTENIALMKESVFAVLGFEYTIYKRTKATFGIGYNYGINSLFKRKYKNKITNERVIANAHAVEFQFGFIF
jgi:hypothetical protein